MNKTRWHTGEFRGTVDSSKKALGRGRGRQGSPETYIQSHVECFSETGSQKLAGKGKNGMTELGKCTHSKPVTV